MWDYEIMNKGVICIQGKKKGERKYFKTDKVSCDIEK